MTAAQDGVGNDNHQGGIILDKCCICYLSQVFASDDGLDEKLCSQVYMFIPVRASVELLSGLQAVVNYQQGWLVVSCQFTRSTSGKSGHLCFPGDGLYSAHGSIIAKALLLTPKCQTVNTSFSPQISSAAKSPRRREENHLKSRFILFFLLFRQIGFSSEFLIGCF